MGNAPNLRRNHTWSVILDEMEKKGQICFGFPIACAQHPEQVRNVSEPGQLPRIAPLGMSKEYAVNALFTPRQVAVCFHAGSNFPAGIRADLW